MQQWKGARPGRRREEGKAGLERPHMPTDGAVHSSHAAVHTCTTHANHNRKVYGHGFLTKDGLKMGKALGNTLDPQVGAGAGAVVVWRTHAGARTRVLPLPTHRLTRESTT